MHRVRRHQASNACLRWILLGLVLSGCSTSYRFQYQYTMTSPPGGTEGLENDRVQIQLAPEPETAVMQLTVVNKGVEPLAIVWTQTHYIDPFGRRVQATETGAQWFFRVREWFTNETRILGGQTLRTRVHPGEHQTYNPFTVSRAEGGSISLSSDPQPLLPTSGNRPAVGQRYQDREFSFVLALLTDTNIVQYPFTFRITGVQVTSP